MYIMFQNQAIDNLPLVKNLLDNSYKKPQAQKKEINGFFRDDSLSGQRAQVYHNPETKQTYVTHRGTASAQDILTDVKLAFGNKTGDRFKHARDIQKLAVDKYGKENITTAGHSLGAVISEKLGKKQSDKVITFNKPVIPRDLTKRVSEKQLDIRSRNDPVSLLRPFQKGAKALVIGSKKMNPFSAHKLESLQFK